jgi:tRNA pseudouridine32 synthase / 23S rRNA pseudouridine746 synthase
MYQLPEAFIAFKADISTIPVPHTFTFPFQYEPHTLSCLAATETQQYIENYKSLDHNFGLDTTQTGLVIGKMFGVLVVQAPNGAMGYLRAFSGKLGNENHHEGFVPPIFDMLTQDSYFLQEEEVLNQINRDLEELLSDNTYLQLKTQLLDFITYKSEAILNKKAQIKQLKNERKAIRESQKELLNPTEFEILDQDLIKQSLRDKHELKLLTENLERQQITLQEKVNSYENQINSLKADRKDKSNALQNYLFNQYQFLNKNKETKGLIEIFEHTALGRPPAAAGDCAAPKLLQYAFANNLKPICMAEFWWGASPKSEIRKHKQYYPSCSGKCEPILGHMLQGIAMDENPLLQNFALNKDYEIVYQDEDIVLVNKPEEMLSVPGINIQDSVYTRIKKDFPEAEGPIIVHRLDMSTSGLLLLALNKRAHKYLQAQFIKHTIEKRYEALLDGIITQDEGFIDLPLRGDLEDRPRQMVCYEYGKSARTRYQVQNITNGKTLIHFWPITGRTHQLRMHASHPLGLNCPIVGDDLYGKKNNRLHLHAGYIKFIHPTSKKEVEFTLPANF